MGNAASQTPEDARDLLGFHVLKISPNSPAAAAGLIPYFDFLIGVNGHPFVKEDNTLTDALAENLGRAVILTVFNCRDESCRELSIVPSNTWGGTGLLGLTIRFCSVDNAVTYVWHILDVYQNSPAAEAGLRPFEDYVVGTPDMLFTDEADLGLLVSRNDGNALSVYVYNSKTMDVRTLHITPNSKWGGSGSLGCELGFGLLHQVPKTLAGGGSGRASVPRSAPAPVQAHVPVQAPAPVAAPASASEQLASPTATVVPGDPSMEEVALSVPSEPVATGGASGGGAVVAPTAAPVVAPTAAPVVAEAAAPVVAEAAAPVVAEAAAPVVAPTAAPVVAPTAAPVVAPTAAPVAAPTTTSTPAALSPAEQLELLRRQQQILEEQIKSQQQAVVQPTPGLTANIAPHAIPVSTFVAPPPNQSE